MKFYLTLSVFLASALLAALTIAGCDSNKLDDDEKAVAEVIEQLSNAKTQSDASAAIDQLLQRAQIGYPVQGSPYADIKLDNNTKAALAEALAAYNGGTQSRGSTVQALFEAYSTHAFTPWGNLATVLNDFNNALANAADDPDSPAELLILVIAARGDELPDGSDKLAQNTVLSPAQALLFVLWLNNEQGNRSGLDEYLDPADCFDRCDMLWLVFCPRPNDTEWCGDGHNTCIQTCHDQGGGSN